jgi:hypothetical protein
MYFDRRSHSGRYQCPPETAGEVQESDLRRESVNKRIDGSVGGRPYEIDQQPEETPTQLKKTNQYAKGGSSLPQFVLRAPL